MKEQSYRNHRRFHPIFHFLYAPLSLLTFIAALAAAWQTAAANGSLSLSALIVAGLALLALLSGFLARLNAIVVQDRVIRTEEQLRYHMLTGRSLDSKLTPSQIAALRFASDAEFPKLSERAVAEGLSPNDIKRAIVNWRPDHWRV
ncbi:DUF6526 family protein [Paenibacillus sp. TRM 82003]|nr:DUF6526 family protein [Paenibacillus sp. TRM 82003]